MYLKNYDYYDDIINKSMHEEIDKRSIELIGGIKNTIDCDICKHLGLCQGIDYSNNCIMDYVIDNAITALGLLKTVEITKDGFIVADLEEFAKHTNLLSENE